jgi:SWI/SNF-related matrix-associated actin-dependent regulator 1 of chromatin subfamily A
MTIIEHPKEYHITIEFDHWRERNIKAVKSLPQRYWNPKLSAWVVSIKYKDLVNQLEKTHKAKIMKMPEFKQIKKDKISPMPDLDFELELKEGELRGYQAQGVARGLQLKRFINGDEQGLGKTIQTIVTLYIAHLKGEDVFPAVIIVPASMKINWQREWHKWTPIKAVVLDDKNRRTWHRFIEHNMAQVYITNYESMKKFFVDIYPPKSKMRSSLDIQMSPKAKLFKSIVVDESHRLKDRSTQQAKIALRLAMGKFYRILLTGTPVINKPADLISQLAIMGYMKKKGSLQSFNLRYCAGGSGSSNLSELNYIMNKSCFFRREKKDVAKDLPDKQRQTILCDITNRSDYNRAKNQFVKWLEDQGFEDEAIARKLRGEIMVKMGELKRISALGKMEEVKGFIQEVLESGEKLIVFCTLHKIVDEVLKLFPGAVTVTGRDNGEEKQANIDAFQTNPRVQLIVCNIKSAGVGITLTASSRVAFIEYPWTSADCVQCEDRAHRIGQKNNVMCTYFLGRKTIDEDLFDMIQKKANISNQITGATDEMETNYIDDMMSLFKPKPEYDE